MKVYLALFSFLNSMVLMADPIKAYSKIEGGRVRITLQNNTEDLLFLSDPKYFGLTVNAKNGGRLLGDQPFGRKNSRLVLLYPVGKEHSNPEARYEVVFESKDFNKALSGERKVVVWLCLLGKVISGKSVDLERVEVELKESK